MKWKRPLALALASALAAGLLSGCAGTGKENAQALQVKVEALRAAALSDQVREWLEEDPAGEAGYAVFLSVCGGEERAVVCHGTGDTLDAAWDAAARSAETAVRKGGPAPLWVKADLVYVSAPLSAAALTGIGEVFGAGGFRYGLAFDSDHGTALLEAELNTAGILDYENGGLDLEALNAYLKETGRAPLNALPESYTAFQCAGWLCDEDGAVLQLGLEDEGYGRREYAAVSGDTAAALALDGAEYLAEGVEEDGSVLQQEGEPLPIPRHAEVLSAMLRGYQLYPGEALAGSIDRAAGWLAGQIAYTEGGIAFPLDNGEITLEGCALSLIAFADCAEASGDASYLSICQALGSGILSLLDTATGTFTHVLDAADLSRKEAFRSSQWDSMGVTALCRLYGLTGDALWLWAAEQVLDRAIAEEDTEYGDLWAARAAREMVRYARDRADYFAFALKNAQGSLAGVYAAQGTAPEGLEMLMLAYETYQSMLDAGYSADGFEPELLKEVVSARAKRQLDGYLFPELAMYYPQPRMVLGAFMDREDGLRVTCDALCRSIGGYYLYAVNYDSLENGGEEPRG